LIKFPEIFSPQLRVAKIEIKSAPKSGLSMEQSAKLNQVLTNSLPSNSLSHSEWAIAGESSPKLEDQGVIYSKMTELFRSALAYNNMAVVRMRQAQRTLDEESKEVLWEEAERLLEQANRIEVNPYSLHNQGQILALKKEYWEAYKKLSEASGRTEDSNFIKANEGLRGALDIIRGDYKLATLRFDYDFSEPKDFFNKGLAHFLLEDYAKADFAFEQSVIAGRQFGYGYYGLALIAVGSGQEEVALIQLKKAIDANKQLYQKAIMDPLFEELRQKVDFFTLFN
jgi:tetratricopeptide (TPR) repeat protein